MSKNIGLNRVQAKVLMKSLGSKKFRSSKGVLKCLVDANSHKWAQKMYYEYVSDSNFSKFPLFLQELDNLLYKFGAKTAKKKALKEDDDMRHEKKKNKNKDA